MNEFNISIGLHVLQMLNILIWGLYIKTKHSGTGIIRCLFPIDLVFSKTLPLPILSVAMLVVYVDIMLLQDIAMLLTGFANEVYAISFIIIIVYELFILSKMCIIILGDKSPFVSIFMFFSVIAITGGLFSLAVKDLFYLNIVDFCVLIVKLSLSILIILIIMIKGLVARFAETLFIIVGFTVFFSLHMFASGFLFKDYLGEWYFPQIATVLVLLYWFIGSLWLRKLNT